MVDVGPQRNFLNKGIFQTFLKINAGFGKIKYYEFLLEIGKINGLVEPLNYMEPSEIFGKKRKKI